MKEKYEVQPMKSWGQLPLNIQETWKQRTCDLVFTAARMGKRTVSQCVGNELPGNAAFTSAVATNPASKQASAIASTGGGLKGWFGGGSSSSEKAMEEYWESLPLVAVMAATTTRLWSGCLQNAEKNFFVWDMRLCIFTDRGACEDEGIGHESMSL